MSNSTTTLDLIAASQSQKEVTANALFDAASPAMLYGRRAISTAGLTWGYYGGYVVVGGTPVSVANGTVTLTASATNYVEADATTGTVSANTSAFTVGKIPLYQIVVGASTVTSYIDVRAGAAVAAGGASVADGDKGDVVVSGGGAVWTIEADAVTYAKMQNVSATDKLLGRSTAGAGNVEEITCTAFARSILDDADAAAVRATIGAGTSSTTGDVVGPASAVNDRVAFFDGTTGKLIKDSGLSLSGTNTGDQTSVTGNAGTATALQTARTIGGVSFDGTGNITQPFDVHAFYPGVPTSSAIVLRVPIARAVTFPSAMAGSYGTATVAATAQTDFDVKKNGSSVGTIRFAAAATTSTFIAASSFSFAAGDILSIHAPASADATLANVGVVIAGAR